MLLKKNQSNDPEAVKKVQRFLGITVDGVYGPKTEAAVKQWQHVRGLESDGIVGPKTWAKMFPDSTQTKCVDESVVYLPLSVHVTKKPGRKIKYLAIHYTAGGSSGKGRARAIKNVFEKRQASADFAVDDFEMVQFNPDIENYYCWAVGDNKSGANPFTVSIEICSNLKKGTYSTAGTNGSDCRTGHLREKLQESTLSGTIFPNNTHNIPLLNFEVNITQRPNVFLIPRSGRPVIDRTYQEVWVFLLQDGCLPPTVKVVRKSSGGNQAESILLTNVVEFNGCRHNYQINLKK